ncbi:MAG TPA: L,D-transpeptidase family protein, partial [Chloroflexota bacterium]|nr:L,D-transpeptidase family protein [Chloroflexota bacterium]
TFANADAAFGIIGPPPTIQNPSIQGTTQVVDNVPVVGPTDQANVAWSISAEPTGALDHVAYLTDHQSSAPTTVPTNATILPAATANLPLPDLTDGQWFVHLWAVDKAGQVSTPASVAVTVMRQPLKFGDVFFRTWATNPAYQTVPIQFTISRAATVTLTIFPESSTTVVRRYDLGSQQPGQPIKTAWDGKDAKGTIAAVGNYRFLIDAVDQSGTDTQGMYTGLTIINKVIKVSLGAQRLTAYEGDKPFVTTLVTTGGADIPTPTGQFEILEKSSPFVFHSPYPKGNKYWYPDVTSNRAMLFDQKDADFIHDAPWRSKFGPGTNGPGVPGQVYTGSHGCVESPTSAMAQLYPWTPLGTPVVITQ